LDIGLGRSMVAAIMTTESVIRSLDNDARRFRDR